VERVDPDKYMKFKKIEASRKLQKEKAESQKASIQQMLNNFKTFVDDKKYGHEVLAYNNQVKPLLVQVAA